MMKIKDKDTLLFIKRETKKDLDKHTKNRNQTGIDKAKEKLELIEWELSRL